jgi:hypothetical protein
LVKGVVTPEADFSWVPGHTIYTDGGVLAPALSEAAIGAVAAVQFVGNEVRACKMVMPPGYPQTAVAAEHLAIALVGKKVPPGTNLVVDCMALI